MTAGRGRASPGGGRCPVETPLPLVDAHAHLADDSFAADLPEVLARARAAGVRRIVCVAETPADSRRVLELAKRHPLLAPAIGLYPSHLDEEQLEEMTALIRGRRDELIAIGEIGLDRWIVKDEGGRARQLAFFLRQVELARELDLPVNVHSRSAGRRTVAALREAGARRVLLHAFDGRAGAALEGARAGFFFSIPPSIVRSRQKQKLVAALPLESLLLETDSPVLGPDPGSRNEPANVTVALEEIARIKRISEEEVARATTRNALRLFGERLLPPG
ncbi:MAG: TatD family deoxyribonuclease [Acidobacteria bacterium]|nr:MAG: TatD family deoxyribonuclease [Acidobacteriota bacterium]